MKGLHRIGNSKEPTFDQLRRMCNNLRVAYPNSYNVIEIKAWHTSGTGQHFEFWLSIDGIWQDFIKSWPAVISKYRELMKEAKNENRTA